LFAELFSSLLVQAFNERRSSMSQQGGKRALQAWFSQSEVARIDRFRREQDDPSWAKAIRDLVQLGLAATGNDEKQGRAA
jgi:hypothetical protein